jgi:hypothetical protein
MIYRKAYWSDLINGVALGDILTDTPTLISGTYSPTSSNITNISTTINHQNTYLRQGDIVEVSGAITITTTGNGLTKTSISLPITSNFTNNFDGSGTAIATTTKTHFGSICSNTSDYMILEFEHIGSIGPDIFRYVFSYVIK